MLPSFRRSEPEAKPATPVTVFPSMSNTPTNAPPALSQSASPFAPRAFVAVVRADERKAATVIGTDLTIAGNLISKGEVHVEGTVDGDIHGSHVVVGETAVVTGNICAEEVVVRGHVSGTVRAKRVMLQATSEVEGDIFHQSLSIEPGAMFEGKSRRTSDDPRTMTLQPEPQPSAAAIAPPALPGLSIAN